MKCKFCPNSITEDERTGICHDCWWKPFPIKSICRDDLEEIFSDDEIVRFGDNEMVDLTYRMAKSYLEDAFWLDMELIGKSGRTTVNCEH